VLGRSAEAIAFRDLNPQAPFHVLVAPLDHHENAAASAAADPASLGHVVALADEVAQEAGNADYRMIVNTGAGAGQTVFHTHVHVLAGSTGMTEALV
jgi:histidine triad (HIT) family protein